MLCKSQIVNIIHIYNYLYICIVVISILCQLSSQRPERVVWPTIVWSLFGRTNNWPSWLFGLSIYIPVFSPEPILIFCTLADLWSSRLWTILPCMSERWSADHFGSKVDAYNGSVSKTTGFTSNPKDLCLRIITGHRPPHQSPKPSSKASTMCPSRCIARLYGDPCKLVSCPNVGKAWSLGFPALSRLNTLSGKYLTAGTIQPDIETCRLVSICLRYGRNHLLINTGSPWLLRSIIDWNQDRVHIHPRRQLRASVLPLPVT